MLELFIGYIMGVFVIRYFSKKEIGKIKKMENRAEQRAIIHFKKLNQIEKILKESEIKKENYFKTIEKIKEIME